MKFTPNLNLKKPDLTEYVNVEDLNGNMDTLDMKIGDIETQLTEGLQGSSNSNIMLKRKLRMGVRL